MSFFRRNNFSALFLSACLTLVVSGITFFTLNDYGIVWDEPVYFANGGSYWEWYKVPNLSKIPTVFRVNPEFDFHPPLRKLIAGITHDLLSQSIPVLDNTRGYRISTFVYVVPFVFLFSYVSMRLTGLVPGLIASALLFFHPIIFALSNLLTLDYATMTLWFFMGCVLINPRITPLKSVLLGLLAGAALLTKSHGLVFALGIGFYWVSGSVIAWIRQDSTFRAQFPFRRLLGIAGITILVLTAGWPYLWSDPVGQYVKYLITQRSHLGVPSLFFGYINPTAPAWYVPFMVFATMPIFSVILVLSGILYAYKSEKPILLRLLYFAMMPLLFFMLPGITRYDGIRLLLPALPFLYLLGAFSLNKILELPRSKNARLSISAVLVVSALYSIGISTVKYHPYQLSYFNEVIGGIRGANQLQLDTEMWGGSFKDVLPYMNERKGTYFCIFPNTAQFYYYQAMGALEPGVIFDSDREACEYQVILMRRGLFPRDPFISKLTSESQPVHTVTFQSVPLVSVYFVPEEERKEN